MAGTGAAPAVTIIAFSGVYRWVSLARLLLHPPGSMRPGSIATRPVRVAFVAATAVTLPARTAEAAVKLAALVGNAVRRLGDGLLAVEQGGAAHGAWTAADTARVLNAMGFAGAEGWARHHWGDAALPCDPGAAIAKWASAAELPAGWPAN